jgi:tetratricopeptide (TPR) repeat protein
MKKFTLYAVLAVALLIAAQAGVYAQKSDATAKASELVSQGRIKDAIAALDKAVEKNKDLYAVYKFRASLKRMTGDFAGALGDYSLAIEQKTDDGELYEQRAMMRLYSRQDSSLVLADLDAAVANGRRHEKVYATRAMIKMQMRDTDGAIADYETAIGLKPDYAGAYFGLSTAYMLSRNEEKAVDVLEKYIAYWENSGVKPETVNGKVVATSGAVPVPNISGDKNASITQGAVIIKGLEGKTTDSLSPESSMNINDKTNKMEQTKNTAAAYASLARTYHRRDETEKASVMVEKALALDPDCFEALETRGKIRSDAGNYAGAISDYDAALKIMPSMPQSYIGRGIAKLLSGKEAEAQKDFDKFLQIFPAGKQMLDYEIERAKEKLQK